MIFGGLWHSDIDRPWVAIILFAPRVSSRYYLVAVAP